ncbi:uncharacterized protein A1O9_01354 [Exophiala aquamarina CBS 119918]|uniref:Uncharacterized protein n=1 Tax=Exophiala aquamarina CBS 119918 TaxID=1182545 RepID=A0A072PUG7_9EURO|nr:uncharacterized protein A1O9_01354 [Exophiala aquamarina CBS 119918]KEF63377.1 hypothetical protein A1O9_01354 [Exophiala aquamarina CBS 119918]
MAWFLVSVTFVILARTAGAVPALITGTALPPNIAHQAGGGLPNQPGSPRVLQNGLSNFQVANFLENLESAFFQEGLFNLSQWAHCGQGRNSCGSNSFLVAWKSFGVQDVAPCQYIFPVTDQSSFFALGNIITTVGIGALVGLQSALALSDPTIEATIGYILPVESRHDAFFRITANEIPNPTTFETPISGIWAYNLALDFVMAGSCSNLPQAVASLPVFPDLGIVGYGDPSFATPNAPGN